MLDKGQTKTAGSCIGQWVGEGGWVGVGMLVVTWNVLALV